MKFIWHFDGGVPVVVKKFIVHFKKKGFRTPAEEIIFIANLIGHPTTADDDDLRFERRRNRQPVRKRGRFEAKAERAV